MRWLLALALLGSISLHAATGDITGADINPVGTANIYISGFPTNMVFNNGLRNDTNYASYNGTNEVWTQILGPSNALTITLNSWGWNHGTNYAWPRTVYGTKLGRKPYPDQAQSAVLTNGGSPNIARAGIWLDDYIYTTCSNLLLSVTADAFVSNAAISGLSVTNSSTVPPWTPKVNLLNYGWENVVNSNYTTRIIAADHYKIDGISVILTHTNGQTKSNYSMARYPDVRFTRGQNAGVFTNYFDLSDWTNSIFTVDYIARPQIGTPFSTYDNLYPEHMPQPQRFTNLLNQFGMLTPAIAVVDAGAAGPGAVTNVPPAQVDPVHYFTNGMVASQRVAATNNYRGGTVYWREGTTNIMGAVTFARDVDSRIVWAPYPGHSFTILTNTGSSANPGGRLLIVDASIIVTNTTLFNNCERIVLSNCVVNSFGFPIRAGTDRVVAYADACQIQKLGGGLLGFSTDRLAWQLVGCDLNGFTNTLVPWLMVGNYHTNTVSTNFLIDAAPSFLGFPPQQRFVAYNKILGMAGGSTFCAEFGDATYAGTNDAIINNVFEGIALSGGAAKSFTLWAAPTNMTGHVMHNNSIFGFRHQFGYNETGTGWKQISFKNNNIDVLGWVTDAIGGANNTSYTNNWWIMNGVGITGNAIPDTSEVFHGNAEYAHFQNYFRPDTARKPYTWWAVVDRRALSSTSVYGTGNGNYHLLPYSLTHKIQTQDLYEYDIENKQRTAYAPPGAYAGFWWATNVAAFTTSTTNAGRTTIAPYP